MGKSRVSIFQEESYKEGFRMARENVIEKVCNKAMEIVKRMGSNDKWDDVQESIRINKKLVLEINCIRSDDTGSALSFEFYVIANGRDVDGITTSALYDSVIDDVKYLLNCCV